MSCEIMSGANTSLLGYKDESSIGYALTGTEDRYYFGGSAGLASKFMSINAPGSYAFCASSSQSAYIGR